MRWCSLLLIDSLSKLRSNKFLLLFKSTGEDKNFFNNLADSFFENNEYKSAIENYTNAIDINNNDPFLYLIYFDRGPSKFELKDYLGVLSDYSKAIN